MVCRFTPSRIGTICSIFSKPSGGSGGCCVCARKGAEKTKRIIIAFFSIEILQAKLTAEVFSEMADELTLLCLKSKTQDEVRNAFHSHLASASCRKTGNQAGK